MTAICTVCKAEVSSWRVVAGQPQCMRCSEGTPTLEEQVATLTRERDAEKARADQLQLDYDAALISSGDSILKCGEAAQGWLACEAERDAALAEVAALRDVAEDFLLVLKDDGAECTCEPGDTCPLCRCTEALARAPVASAQRLANAVKRADAKDRAIATLRAALELAREHLPPRAVVVDGRCAHALAETAWTVAPAKEPAP